MIKKLFLTLTLAILAFTPALSRADTGFDITSFHSDLSVEAQGTVQVSETIDINFTEQRHGIYRDLPVTYQREDGSAHYTDVKDIAVFMDGQSAQFSLIRNKANLRIKIGDPDALVSGQHTYVVTYRMTGVLANYNGHDELYWNVTGNGWEVPIEAASASVSVANAPISAVGCFIGAIGSTENCAAVIASDNKAEFKSTRLLRAGEGMTVGTAYAPGIIPILTVTTPTGPKPAPAGYVALGFVILVGLAAIFISITWWRNGRDEYYKRKSLHDPDQSEAIRPLLGAHEPIVPEYDPPAGLRPAEIGVLMDEKADDADISATIVDLGVRGYLTITEKEKKGVFLKPDYVLTKTAKPAADLLPFEKILYDRLFKAADQVSTVSLKNKFHTAAQKAKDELYKSLVEKKYFAANPEDRRRSFGFSGWILIAAGVGFFIAFSDDLSTLWPNHEILRALLYGSAAGLVGAGALLWGVSFFMPKRTALGREVYRQAQGYRLFVSGTEKYRQPFFERENIFMQVLPYAMVFGVTHKLTAAMEEMHLEPAVASWYIGSGAFHYSAFSNSLDGLSNSLSSSMAAAPNNGFGGSGGFSGGGFGGGGGGSW